MYIDINIIDHRLTTNILTTTNGKWPKRSFSNFINHFALKTLETYKTATTTISST